MKTARYILLSSLVFLPLLSFSAPALALSVNPAIEDLSVDPGKTDVRTIAVTNDEQSEQTYTVTLQKFIPKGETGQQEFLAPSDTQGILEWMFVNKPEITLKPGQTGSIQVALSVPGGTKAGGYYAGLFLSKRQAPGEELAVLPRLGILFFVRVNGAVEERLRINDVALDGPGNYEYLPVGFRISIVNEGNVHVIPQGTVRIKNVFGSTVAKLQANPDASRILPASTRLLSTAWRKGSVIPPGDGFFNGLRNELMNFAIGPYEATVSFSDPAFTGATERTVKFSVWPWRSLVSLTALLALLCAGFVLLKRLIIKNATAGTDSRV